MEWNNEQRVDSKTAGFALAAAVAVIANTFLVWVKELSPSLLAFMKATFYHHWIGHGLIIVVLCFVLGMLLSKTRLARHMSGTSLAWLVFIATALGALGIFGFYVRELLG